MSRSEVCSKCKNKRFYKCDCGCNVIKTCECYNDRRSHNKCCDCRINFPGPIGFNGATGMIGSTGLQGASGIISMTGATGFNGFSGLTGSTGLSGNDGPTGICCTGPTGFQGSTGLLGFIGATGLVINEPGATGLTGLDGPSGLCCTFGGMGVQGPIGIMGPLGLPGIPSGQTGATGIDGLIGATGMCCSASGLTGATGPLAPNIYGSVYSIFTNSQVLNGNTGLTLIQFNQAGPLPTDPNNQIIRVGKPTTGLLIPKTGNYEADYTVTVATLGFNPFSLILNGSTQIPNSQFQSAGNEIIGNVIFSANSGDIISLGAIGQQVTLATTQLSIVGHTLTRGSAFSITSPLNMPFNGITNSIYVFLQSSSGFLSNQIVTDSLSRNYTFITMAGNFIAVYYLDNAESSVPFTVTATFSAPTSSIIEVVEIINASSPSLISYNIGGGTGSSPSTIINMTLSPTSVGQLMLMGVIATTDFSTVPFMSGSMSILDSTTSSAGISPIIGADAYQFATTTGSQNVFVTYTQGGGDSPLANYNTVGVVIGVGNFPLLTNANNASLIIEYLN